MVVTNLTLTQAWFPAYAIAWNAPAWALSAFAMFYIVFPFASRWIAGCDRTRLRVSLIAMVLLSLFPAIAFLIADPEGNAWTATSVTVGGFWLNVLRFDPLVWLPQFLSGLVLGRLIRLEVDAGAATFQQVSRPWVSAGDLGVAAVVLLLSCWSEIPYVLLGHGLLVPITLAILADLARGRGLMARALLALVRAPVGSGLRPVRATDARRGLVGVRDAPFGGRDDGPTGRTDRDDPRRGNLMDRGRAASAAPAAPESLTYNTFLSCRGNSRPSRGRSAVAHC